MNDNALNTPWTTSPRPVPRLAGALATVVCALALGLLWPSPAQADSATAGGDVQVAQTLGDRDLTFVLRRVTGLPGPLHVDVVTHRGTPAGTLRLGTVPTGVSEDRAAGAAAGTVTSRATVALGRAPGSYGATLRIDRAGPWELVVQDGSRTARIPFVAPGQVTSPPERLVFGGFVAAGVLMLVTLLVAVRARSGRWVLLPAGGVLAAVATAVTAAVLSASLPAPPEPGRDVDATQDNVTDPYAVVRPVAQDRSRQPASLALRPYTARPGRPGTLRLSVLDGSTGLPADDLIVHDGALMHLLVIGPTGQLWHLHPVRTAPGSYEVQLRLPAAGHYAVSAEVARRGGGVQQLRSATGLTVSGDTPEHAAQPPRAQGPGTRTLDGVPVRFSTSSSRAGTATTLTARVGTTPVLQPWLGMIGHLIVVGPLGRADATDTTHLGRTAQDAAVWAHAHSMGGEMGAPAHDMAAGHGMAMEHGTASMPDDGATDSAQDAQDGSPMSGLMPLNGDSPADETVAAYGPDVSFVYTFPAAGYYRLWIQVERDSAVITLPYVLHVPSAGEPR
ncbi:hypothetical protein [Streptomyces tremellae]|uniref:hypothetical protein n=1 Tax=Streptomyces tremellae TaxID=1124239 RepID=UPI0031E754A0